MRLRFVLDYFSLLLLMFLHCSNMAKGQDDPATTDDPTSTEDLIMQVTEEDGALAHTDGTVEFSDIKVLQHAGLLDALSNPQGVPQQTVLRVCLMIERGSDDLLYNYDKAAGAIDLAVDYANQEMLRRYNIVLFTTYYDIGSACSTRNHMVAYALSLKDKGVTCNAFVGPGCGSSLESLYDFASYLHVPIIGCPAASVGINADASEYPYMSRLSITHVNTAIVIVTFLQAMNYTTPVLIYDENDEFYQEMEVVFQSYLKRNNRVLLSAMKFFDINGATDTVADLNSTLITATVRSRVLILMTNATATRRLMIIANALGYTNGSYVFLAVELYKSSSWGFFTYEANDGQDDVAARAYQVLLIAALLPDTSTTYEIFENDAKKASAVRSTYSYHYDEREELDLIVSHFYEAVIYYASLIRDLAMVGRDVLDINQILALMATNYSFYSPIHGQIDMDDSGDRIFSYIIQTFDPDVLAFVDYLGVPPRSKNLQRLGNLNWPGDASVLPPNRPLCGFDGKDPVCAPKPLASKYVTLAIVLPALVLAAALIFCYIQFKKWQVRQSDPFWWRIYMQELSVVSQVARFKSTAQSMMRSQAISKKSVNDDALSVGTTATGMSLIAGYLYFTKTAVYRDNPVGLRELPQPCQKATSELIEDLADMKNIHHNNLQAFYGIAVNDENLCELVVGEVCSKGSVMTLIEKRKLNLDWDFKHAIIKDIVYGMTYLHTTRVSSHGNLNAHTCLVENRFIIKITDYGLEYFRDPDDMAPPSDSDEERDFSKLLWRAPELLRRPVYGGTKAGDVYSFAIILQQLTLRSEPFEGATQEVKREDYDARVKELVLEVKRGSSPPLRPMVPISASTPALHGLMESCWEEYPELRPSFAKVRETFWKMVGKSGDNIVNHLIRRMEQYAAELEVEAQEKLRQFMDEKSRSEAILSGMLPRTISEALQKGLPVLPEVFDNVTVLFSHIVDFDEIIQAAATPFVTIEVMNTLYSTCDHVIESYKVYKVETVNDAYLLVCGLPVRVGNQHATIMAALALQLRKEISALSLPGLLDRKLQLRAGLNSGPCVAAVIGTRMPRYCLFGDTVNTASRMESSGEAGKLQCSNTTRDLLERDGHYFLTSRGVVEIKGKGPMETFWLIAKTAE